VSYWASNAFIPDLLTHVGKAELIGGTLTWLNLGQLPVSFLLLAIGDRLVGRAWPLIGMGVLTLIGLAGMLSGDGLWIESGAALVGFSCAGILILMLSVPPLVCAAEDVARTTAGMFVIGYSCSVVVPILGGVIWDATHSPYPAFALIALSGLGTLILPRTVIHRPAAQAA